MATPSYRIHRCANGYVVALVGRGTLQETPAFRDFVEQCLENQLEVIVDLSRCDFLDSTFQGCLIGLHRESMSSGRKLLRVFADEQCRLQLLSTSGLHKLLDFVAECPTTQDEGISLDFGHFGSQTLGRHVMNSHRLLAELGGEDANRFREIADRLQAELAVSPVTRQGEATTDEGERRS